MSVLFWDFDGTLVYSNPLWSTSMYKALRETDFNTTVEFSDIRKCMASGFTWHTPNEDYSTLIGNKWWDFMNNKIFSDYISLGVDSEIAKQAVDKVRSIIKNPDNYKLYSDTVEVLKNSTEKGNTNVILSNNYPDLEEVVTALNLTKYFDRIIVSANIGYDKPRKEIFDIAKSCYPNEKYIMIGDNINADIIGGKNAGIKTILVHSGFCSEADYCFNDLTDMISVI